MDELESSMIRDNPKGHNTLLLLIKKWKPKVCDGTKSINGSKTSKPTTNGFQVYQSFESFQCTYEYKCQSKKCIKIFLILCPGALIVCYTNW